MNVPRFLIGTSLLLWGWQTGMLWVAVIMAIALEAANFIHTRWEFSDSDLYRIYDLCTVLFLGAALYCFISRNTTNDVMTFFQATNYTARGQAASQAFSSAFIFFQWWPMTFFPIAAAQAYGSRSTMPYSTFSWYLRRRAARGDDMKGGLNLGFLYFAIIMIAASVTARRDAYFYFIFCLLAIWALWVVRPKRFSAVVWVCVMIAIVKGGFWGHRGLHSLQGTLEDKFAFIAARFPKKLGNVTESSTGIGSIGEIKMSGRIVMRVEPEGPQVPPLLRGSSYNFFKSPAWYVSSTERTTNVIAEGESTWRLIPRKRTDGTVTISRYMERGSANLALPNGTAQIDHLPVAELYTTRFGAVKAVTGPDLIEYRALYGPGETIDSGPGEKDLSLPGTETNALRIIVEQLELPSKSEADRIKTLEAFFQKNFEYSTYLSIKKPGPRMTNTAVGEFLLNRRTGHCEYFATATVLLLRYSGMPARYVNGYSVQEKEKGGTRYLVRDRHAHAWCLYYSSDDKTWHDFDTTPASWMAVENQNASRWEAWSDYWSNLWYKFSRWRWLGERIETEKYLGAGILVLVAILVWRLFYGKQRTRRAVVKAGERGSRSGAGTDSEFYLVEKRIRELGFDRHPGETLTGWLRRVESVSQLAMAPVRSALSLHYRHRFDPQGLNPDEREELRVQVQTWLKQVEKAKNVIA